jgi:hypothetical protein
MNPFRENGTQIPASLDDEWTSIIIGPRPIQANAIRSIEIAAARQARRRKAVRSKNERQFRAMERLIDEVFLSARLDFLLLGHVSGSAHIRMRMSSLLGHG